MLPHADIIRPLIAMVNPVSICLYLLNISSSRHGVAGIALKGRPSKETQTLQTRREAAFFFKLGHLRQFAAAVHNMKIMRRLTPEQKKKKKRLVENKQCGKSQQRRAEYKCVVYAALAGDSHGSFCWRM